MGEQRVAMCGDLTQRAPRSLLELFKRIPPAELVLIAPAGRERHGVELSEDLRRVTRSGSPGELDGVDVLYLPGLPAGDGSSALDPEVRERYAFNATSARSLPQSAVVISPMPVIDEVDQSYRNDPRVRLFGPSDRSVTVRMAVLDRYLPSSAGFEIDRS